MTLEEHRPCQKCDAAARFAGLERTSSVQKTTCSDSNESAGKSIKGSS